MVIRETLLAWAAESLAQAARQPLCWHCRAEMLPGQEVCVVCGTDRDPFAGEVPGVDPAEEA
jgi:hypothetical protein